MCARDFVLFLYNNYGNSKETIFSCSLIFTFNDLWCLKNELQHTVLSACHRSVYRDEAVTTMKSDSYNLLWENNEWPFELQKIQRTILK